MDILAIVAVLLCACLWATNSDLKRKLREMDNVLLLRDGHIEELKVARAKISCDLSDKQRTCISLANRLFDAQNRLDDAQAELIKRMPRRGADGRFARKV